MQKLDNIFTWLLNSIDYFKQQHDPNAVYKMEKLLMMNDLEKILMSQENGFDENTADLKALQFVEKIKEIGY